MKKRIISLLTMALMLVSLLGTLTISVAAAASTIVEEFTATGSGLVETEMFYGPKFSSFAFKGDTHAANDISIKTEAKVSLFYTDKNCTKPLSQYPSHGQTYYFYIETNPRLDTDFSPLTTAKCKLTMDGITATAFSLKRYTKEGPIDSSYVRIYFSAKITALPIAYFDIAAFDVPVIGSPADHSVVLNADQCTATVQWEKRDSNNRWSVMPSTEKVSATDVLQAFITVTAKYDYYFANNGGSAEYNNHSAVDFGIVGHGTKEVRLMSEIFRMDKLKTVNWTFTGTELNSSDGYCYLTGGNLKTTFASGTNYTLETPSRYLFTDTELKRELKKEPKEGVTYYTRISLSTSNNVPTMEGFDIKNATVTIPGFDVTVTDQRYEGSTFSGDKLWLYLSLTKPIPTFRVSFDNTDGSGMMKDVVMEEGRYTLPECEFTAPAGMQFKAWLVNGRERAPGYEFSVREDVTVQAVWEDIPAVTYTVTFAAGGGSGNMTSVEASGSYSLPKNRFTAPSGKQFKCWKVNGSEKQPGDTINVTANTTVTALWENVPVTTYKVSFSAGGGKGIMTAVTGISGSYTLPECDYTAPEGQQFKAWKVDDAEKQPGESIYVDGNKKIVALWEALPVETTEPATEDVGEETSEPTSENDAVENTENPEETEAPIQPTDPAEDPSAEDQDSSDGIPVWAIILICLLCAAVGLLTTALIVMKKK